MSKPFIVSIPHQLGKDEAVRRLKSGLGGVRTNYGHLFSIDQEVWTGDTLQFRVSAIGQAVSGTIDVAEDHVTLQVYLPWLLAKIAEAVQPLIRKEGTLLLENKK
jgi:Putative polyhydroxyalkanoic acid system protein (PHA_gran_rgn)